MTHLYQPGNPTPYRAFTVCGEDVGTAAIVEERPSCKACRAIYDRRVAELTEVA